MMRRKYRTLLGCIVVSIFWAVLLLSKQLAVEDWKNYRAYRLNTVTRNLTRAGRSADQLNNNSSIDRLNITPSVLVQPKPTSVTLVSPSQYNESPTELLKAMLNTPASVLPSKKLDQVNPTPESFQSRSELPLSRSELLNRAIERYKTTKASGGTLKEVRREIRNLYNKTVVFGIPTVARKKDYLMQTVDSLFEASTPEEAPYFKLVLYNASSPNPHVTLQLIIQKYASKIRDGTITIVDGPPRPEVNESLPRTYDDPIDRVMWRSKQNLDYAGVMDAGRQLGDFYMQLDDDVVFRKEIVTRILSWVAVYYEARTDWYFLTFYTEDRWPEHKEWPAAQVRYSFGHFFRSSELSGLIDFLRTQFWLKPGDWMVGEYLNICQKKAFTHYPPLMEHLGEVSTYTKKTMQLSGFNRWRQETVQDD